MFLGFRSRLCHLNRKITVKIARTKPWKKNGILFSPALPRDYYLYIIYCLRPNLLLLLQGVTKIILFTISRRSFPDDKETANNNNIRLVF